MDRFRNARDKGGAYLLREMHADGSFGDPQLGVTEYYKVPAALLVCGESNAAGRLLDWVQRNDVTGNGDFRTRPADQQESHYYIYHNAWMIKAAQRMGRFDLSQRGMEFLLDFWDPDSGGFYSSVSEREADTKQDLWVVAGAGWCTVYTGMIDVAQGVGRWMERIMDHQPNYPEAMYTVFTRSAGLITEVLDGDDFRYVLTRDEARDQSFYHPGIAAGFLARLHMATGEPEWLDLAREYMRFAEGVGEYHFRLLRAGKVGWAASLLYTLTGEDKYREMAVRVGDNLIETQSADGSWGWKTGDGTSAPSSDITAEMVVWLDEISQAVGHLQTAS